MASAIVAFGSLLFEPGAEISAATVEQRRLAATPFAVEFARSSTSRSGGPTLVPVTTGGAPVRADLLILDEHVTVEHARDILYRREARLGPEATYAASGRHWIADAGRGDGLDHRLYTALRANIPRPTPRHLAELAIRSARERHDGRDGISYLIEICRVGIETPLTGPYSQEVLRRTGTNTLEEARARAHDRRTRSTTALPGATARSRLDAVKPRRLGC